MELTAVNATAPSVVLPEVVAMHWPVKRRWAVRSSDSQEQTFVTGDLAQFGAVILLGAAGLGKTVEIGQLARAERAAGRHVAFRSLAFEAAATGLGGLRARLDALLKEVGDNGVIYLDSLDEASVEIPMVGLALESWIKERLPATVSLRVACRSAVWPGELTRAIGTKFHNDAIRAVELQPLSEEEFLGIAESEGVDRAAFFTAVSAANVGILARQPLTLQLLLTIFRQKGELPSSRVELFSQAIDRLASETKRHRRGTATRTPREQIIDAAERIATVLVLSGRQAVDRAEDSVGSMTASHVSDLADLPRGSLPALDHGLVDSVLATSLFRGEGESGAVFWHRQFAECLAGRRLARLPFHQAQALLSASTERRRLVASQLRQTAVFAASAGGPCSEEITEWLIDSDPELIGQAEASDDLRRRAVRELLARCRRHQITSVQLHNDEISLHNLCYGGIENDLRPALIERGAGLEDVHAFALRLARDLKLDALSDVVAEIVLDDTLPMYTRTSAGYALSRFGTQAARRRLRPLAAGVPDDEQDELKGLALRCNWPGGFSVPELLGHLLSPGKPSFFGAYHGFFIDLEREKFDAAGARVEGLEWAAGVFAQSRTRHAGASCARRIVFGALGEADDAAVRRALINVLDRGARVHLSDLFDDVGNDAKELRARARDHLAANREIRRAIVMEVATSARDRFRFLNAIRQLPGLISTDDFEWLLEQARVEVLPMPVRERLAEVAASLPWLDDPVLIKCWDRVRDQAPIREVFQMDSTDLNSEMAKWKREAHERDRKRAEAKSEPSPPPLAELVRTWLHHAKEDPRHFGRLALVMTLEGDRKTWKLNENPTHSPGWRDADAETRAAIVEAARQLLTVVDEIPKGSNERPLNQSTADGGVSALLLVAEIDPEWLKNRPLEWWQLWGWFIVRELGFGRSTESDQATRRLFETLWSRASEQVRQAIERLATTTGGDIHLRGHLERLELIPDEILDERLCALLASDSIVSQSIATTMAFVLRRAPERSVPICLKIATNPASSLERASVASVMLLREQCVVVWRDLVDAFRGDLSLAEAALGLLASDTRPSRETVVLAEIGDSELGEAAELMMATFPPELDPDRDDGSWSSRQDAALLRSALIHRLAHSGSAVAVAALKGLVNKYGERNPWLRHPLAEGERSYRRQAWSAIEPQVVATVLADSHRRVVRSAQDVVDGVLAALERCERRLHQPPSMVPALWNNARQEEPSPKEEDWASDWILGEIAKAFESRAVVSTREAQIRRRQVAKYSGGAPGSEADILVKVPHSGTADGEPIVVVVEVKRSCNPEARTGMRDQLLNRYLPEAGARNGVFVVAFMDAPGISASHRPIWATIDIARDELERQAAEIEATTGGTVRIAPFVLDCRLDGGRPKMRAKKPQKSAIGVTTKRKKSQRRTSKGRPQRKAPAVKSGGQRRHNARVKGAKSSASKNSKQSKSSPRRRRRSGK